jgi:crotonobetainyl-CoA:carnitine CoA-transferase CaiB-like acyl-CoA transferase
VVELSIAIAAPSCGRALAFHGADVLRIESRTNPDVARLFGSNWAGDLSQAAYMDTSPYLPEMSANKRSIGLELKTAEGRAAATALLAKADVFITNYSTPAVRGLGLGHEDLVAINPGLIYIALPGFGSDPAHPYYEFLAWGPNQAPLTGLDALTGHADHEPAGIATTAPPDYFAGLHALTAVLTALHHRDVTGEGSFVDIAQFETTVSSLGPFLLDHALTGRSVERNGNRLPWLAPQGCYPCLGHDAWVAITVVDEEQWAALASVIDPSAGEDTRFADVAGRVAHHDELDELIGAWTARHTAGEVATWLQEAGVPAHEVLDNIGVIHDPQVRHRHFFQMVESARFPEGDVFSGHPIRLTETPGHWWRAGPSMGQDTVQILTERAGIAREKVDELLASGVAFTDSAPEQTLRRPYSDYAEILGVCGSAR